MKDPLSDREALHAYYGAPAPLAVAVMKAELDSYHRRFIALSPFICIAAAGNDGQPSVSPRGDAPGFVKVLDAGTLVFPDRPGNNKVETFEHLVENPKIALIFFVPGVTETLRVRGEARLSDEPAHRELGRIGAKVPAAAVIVRVTQAYFHCGKALIRSRLWDPSSRVGAGALPPFAEILKAQAAVPETVEQLQCAINEVYTNELF